AQPRAASASTVSAAAAAAAARATESSPSPTTTRRMTTRSQSPGKFELAPCAVAAPVHASSDQKTNPRRLLAAIRHGWTFDESARARTQITRKDHQFELKIPLLN
ncbi:Os06g0218300, partial [Oryza sativa Japonica Group]